MTLDKAIQILIERKVINEQMIGKDKESDFSQFLQEQNDAIDLILREPKTNKKKSCSFCEGRMVIHVSGTVYQINNDYLNVFIKKSTFSNKIYGEPLNINYCPYCGGKL